MTLRGAEGVRRVDEEIVQRAALGLRRHAAVEEQFPTPPRRRPDGGIIRDER